MVNALNDAVEVNFYDSWMWLIFVGIGLVMILLELIIGIETGYDLVFIGTAFVLGGLITLALHSWVWTAIVTGVICVIYVVAGRRYFHSKMAVATEKTNIDTIIGKTGVVQQDIIRNSAGLVKIGMEEWRARAEEEIKEGEEITVTGISGITLNVKKTERSQ
jgi:membrane protein implicated in regulation of membrane protease activity